MNIEIANRLVEFRKKAGYSQEQLADKLGLSRQAVSKWERGEASPDTDNLIALSKLYGVSMDELLGLNLGSNEEKEEAKSSINIGGDGIHLVDDEGSEIHISNLGIKITDNSHDEDDPEEIEERMLQRKSAKYDALAYPLAALISTIVYLLLGFFWTHNGVGWAAGWTVILFALSFVSVGTAIIRKKMSDFSFPVLVTAIYCGLGIAFSCYDLPSFWHPGWVLFLFIPIYYVIAGPVDAWMSKKRKIED